jgi:hypothetical protein
LKYYDSFNNSEHIQVSARDLKTSIATWNDHLSLSRAEAFEAQHITHFDNCPNAPSP